MCGWTRSRWTLSYLGINFFMIVQIFGLVNAIELAEHTVQPFTDYFYVFTFGTLITFACSLIWPENTAITIEKHLLSSLNAATDLVEHHGSGSKRSKSKFSDVKGFNDKLMASIDASKYEVVYSRIPPASLQLINAGIADLINKLYVLDEVLRDLSSKAQVLGSREAYIEGLLADMALLHGRLLRAIVQNMQDAIAGRQQDLEGQSTAQLEVQLNKCQRALSNLPPTDKTDLESRAINDQAVHAAFEVAKNLLLMYGNSVKASQAACHRRRLFWPSGVRLTWPTMRKQPGVWRYWIAHRASIFRDSQHTAYAVKFTLVMGILSIFPFIDDWRVWYRDVRGHWSMISAMVVMEVARGLVFRSALMKGAGAILGGLMALILFSISAERLASILLTLPCAIFIYYIALHPRYGKMGLVAALAYNLVLNQGHTSEEPYMAYLKRTATLVGGIAVAVLVHVLVFPYHARRVLKEETCLAFDALASGFHELAHDADYISERKDVVRHLNAARTLINMTHWEPSLKGPFPKEMYQNVLQCAYQLEDILTYAQRSESCGEKTNLNASRDDVMRSMAKDLYLLAHALHTRSSSIVHLAANLPDALTSYRQLLVAKPWQSSSSLDISQCDGQAESASFFYLCKLMSGPMTRMSLLIHEAIAGRFLPDIIHRTSASLATSPQLSTHKPNLSPLVLSSTPSTDLEKLPTTTNLLPEMAVSAEEREIIAARSRRSSVGGRIRGSNASFLSTLQLPRIEQGLVVSPTETLVSPQPVFDNSPIESPQTRRPSITIQLPSMPDGVARPFQR
ncbi:hypothetical protein BCR37DRAFT_379175 [Protomyces lactucae-debilis]|uniref:Fusaric acid resistance protein-like-domain-containing protein n=1 Tax=Protomyces lactucae-debilis TaxID=2754530 RepID=A0A1Y2FGY3_PROLT|nr:uncharacterized protein BCR37DRAFT_379175 [Protomyces lactucae-debilis]ORY83183.1 hypothetical protein BCR37DRAFT_379175 [Protomyces lactucae-debilis]